MEMIFSMSGGVSFPFFNYVFAALRFLVMVFIQSLSMFSGPFIVSMISFILSPFGILPSLSDLVNFHRDTS